MPLEKIKKCEATILATKNHSSNDSDIVLFIDADLSILGSDWETYMQYFSNIRKEFGEYPDTIYNPERIKVLQQFLRKERISNTEKFFNRYEHQARIKLRKEIHYLKNTEPANESKAPRISDTAQ